MPALDLIDHSPQHPQSAAKLSSASNLVLIDNYDSFTWNVYQYLVLEGATVTVYRNDKITLGDLIATNPTQLVISPGPGHPDTDAGISIEAIKHFGGRIPILGVCMGQQCIISAYGGDVDVTGEILHGKTSPLRHDSKGVYTLLAQDLPVTRYHSLAGTHSTLPTCLELSSWISKGPDGGKGVIMGVRHKEYVVEGVQFHPESILTEEGRTMLKNFLSMSGGRWSRNPQVNGKHMAMAKSTAASEALPGKASILEKIYAHRRQAVEAQKQVPSCRPGDLQAAYDLNLAPPQIDFPDRLKRSPYPLSLMAEIKRASPSKDIISMSTCAPEQARRYATAGASVISVLTEPEWFKGSLEDLRFVRQSVESMPNRPAILRKEFIFDEYQILEARLAGADTVLLIVKMLDVETLARLYRYCRSLGMEPLVEVNTPEEMKIAVGLGAEVIGVNNRDLTSFEVDLGTTNRLMDLVPKSTIVCALSGISAPEDVEAYGRDGVQAVLVGEALMRASDTTKLIADLLGGSSRAVSSSTRTGVKICGTRTAEAATVAIKAGADMIGIILVPGSRRLVPQDAALQISEIVKSTPKPGPSSSNKTDHSFRAVEFFEHGTRLLFEGPRALLVGVFLNATLEHIVEHVRVLDLDVVQLHGVEPLEWAHLIPVPVIRRFAPGETGLGHRGCHTMPLLDSGPGSGKQLDLMAVEKTSALDGGIQFILAGGLNPDNIGGAVRAAGHACVAVDVSSGVETDGQQDHEKIKAFIKAVRNDQR